MTRAGNRFFTRQPGAAAARLADQVKYMNYVEKTSI